MSSSSKKRSAGEAFGERLKSGESVYSAKRNVTPDFTPEIKKMMYGFGDEYDPLPESIELIQSIVIDYISGMVCNLLFAFDRIFCHTYTYIPTRMYFCSV